MRLAQVWSGVPLRQEVALRAGGGGGRRDYPEQVCYLVSSDSWGFECSFLVSGDLWELKHARSLNSAAGSVCWTI